MKREVQGTPRESKLSEQKTEQALDAERTAGNRECERELAAEPPEGRVLRGDGREGRVSLG